MGDIKQVGPKAITAATGATSYVALADAIAFTPTFNNFTVGNGSVWGYYQTINDVCHISCGFVMGSTSSIGGTLSLSALPETSSNNDATARYPMLASCKDATGVDSWNAYLLVLDNNTATSSVRKGNDSAVVNASAPFTWATSDSFSVNGSYPIN